MRPSRPALAVSTSASAEDASVHHRLAQLEEEVAQLRADNARLNEALLQLGTENEMCQSSVGFVRQPGASPPDRRTQRLGGPTPPVTDLELSEEPAESVRALRRWETWKFLKDFTEFLEQQPTLGFATGRLPPSQCPDLVSAERRLRLSTVAEGQHAPPVGGNQWFGEARWDYDFPQGSGLDFALSGGSSSSDARSAFEKFRHFGEEAGRLPATGAACPGPESDKRLTPVGLVRQRRAEGPERRWYTSPPRSLSPTEGTSPEALPQGPWRASFNMGELTRRQGHLSLSGGCGPRDGDDLRYQGICTKPAAPSARSPTVGFGSWASDAGPFYKSDCSTIKQDAAMALQAPLLAAVTQGDSAQVENILATSSEDLRELLELRDERGRTPLHCAARHGHAEVCSVLLKRRADIHAPAGAGIAALALACLWRHGAVVRLLLKSRARPEQIDHGGQSAFHFACCNSPEIVHDFLQQNPDLAFLKDAQSRNPLFYAVGNNSSEAKMEILRMLLEAKCRAGEVDVFGRSALHYAAQSGDMTTVEELQQAIDQEVPPCALRGELQVATNFADAALVEEDHSQEAAEAASAAHVSPFSDEHDKISEFAEAAPAARTVHGQREGETNDKAEAAAATAEEERKQSEVVDVIEAAAIAEEELQQSEVAVETAATVEEERQKSDATNATEAVAAVAEEERQQSEVADVIEAAAIAQEERQQSEFAHATQRAATADDERQKTESAEVIEAAAATSGEERQQSEAADSTAAAAATAEGERQQNEIAEEVEAAASAEEDEQKSEVAGVMQTVVTAEDVEEGPSKDGATLELLASQVLSLDSLCQTHKAEGTEAEQAAARADEAEQERQMWEDRAGAAATVIGRHWKKRQTALSPAGSWKESLFLMLREEAAITDSRDSGSITYRGNIREGAENCWISFPGKYASAWKALTEENQGDSVACVFLCTKEDGLGVHLKDPQEHKWEKSSGPRYEIDEESGKITFRPDVVKDPKKPGERCYCHRIYGKRGFKQFGYYRELRRPFTSQRVQEETATAEAMNAAWVKEDAAAAVKAATRERARATWEEHGGIAAWGCAWFEVWFDRVTEAVSKHQRLKAVFFPGQEGQGVVPMDQLPEADLWDGIGCGGSQKSEIATVNHMRETEGPRWDYDEVSVAKFLHSEFADGCVVEGWCEEEKVWKRGILEHQEIEVRKVPREEDGVTRMVEVADVVFDIHCEGESGKLKTKDIRHVGRIMEDMMQECGLQNVMQSALECLKDMNIELLECSVDQWALRLDLRIQDIRSLQALRDRVLDGSFERELTQKLAPDQTLRVHVDKSRFFTLYEDSLQGLDGLTAHQQEKLEEMEGEADVHLSAPAGAGKTFVAMQRVLEALGGPTSDAHVLYVAPSKALLLFFLRWLAVRLTPQEDADGPSNFENFENALKRLSLLHHPYKSMILPKLQQGRIILPPGPEAETMFHLAVYDESHKIFGQEAVDKTLLNRVNALRRLFLSDEAQSSAVLHSFPAAKRVKLSEVVRSTERIVLAAAMFRYSSDENENVTSHGKSLGPPLKTFLFQPDQEKNRFTQYSKQIVAALWHAVRMFPNMSLHGRIAILVRDQHFRRQLYLHLQQALNEDLRHRRLQIVSFAESLLQLPERLLKSSSQPHRECIVLDSLENADGIEQLIVICVGLDEPLKKDGDQNFCSQLYRALTRAQLLAMVVNEHVQGGLLEFLGAVRFSDRKAARPPNCQEVVRKAVYENQASETGNADDEASEAAEAAATNMPADGSHVVTLFSDPDTTPSETDAAQPKPRSSVTSKAADARLLQAAAAEAAQMTDIWDTRENAIPQVTTLQFNPMTQVCERLFLTTELPPTVEHHDDATSFHGLIRPHADACWISIPDHFEAAWKPVTELHHDQSVADVLFCDQESGLGQHFADPENPGKCYCARIYGERDYQRFGYLWTVDDEETRKGRAAEMAATQAVIVRSDATDETRERAQRMAVLQWMRCGKTASWGCAWFERWQSNVRKAVAKKQRLLVAFLPGQVGQGKVAMCDLPTSDLWDGIGLSAKQKVQVAIAEEMGWEYEAIDLVDLVRTAFPEGCLADGMDESGWWRLCKLGQMTFQDEKFSWAASSLNSGQEFKAVRVQHVGREILSLMDSVGPDYVFDFLCRGLVDTEVLQCEKAVAPRGGHALCITLQCSNSDALQKLGQKIMDGELERVLNTRLRAKGWSWPVQLDRTRFAKLSSAGDQDPFPGVSWQWFHRTGWRDYPRDVITQIEQAYRAGETKAHFQNGKRTGSEALEISFEEMLQRDPLSGDTREVKRAGPFEFLGLGDSEYEIVVDRTSGARLGITPDYEDGQTMVIDSIDEGLVKDWNEHAFSDTKVDIMDRIVEVNGIRGNIHPMARECKENKVLRLRIAKRS